MTLHILHSAIRTHTHTRSHTDGGGCNRGHQPVNQGQSRTIRANLEPRINLLINLRRSISWAPAAWFISSKAECKTVQNSCDQVGHKQKSLLFPWVVRNDSNWTIFFGMLSKSETCSQGKKEWKNLTELKAVNVQLRGRILTNHMGLLVVTATGSSCRCRSLRGAAWLFPAGNVQVSRKPHRRGCRGRRPAAKESRLESEGPAEEKIDARLNHVTKPKKQKKNKTTICFGLFICAWH